jgi:CDP-glucose 4,6-dehydratase
VEPKQCTLENLVNNFSALQGVYKNKKILVTGHTGFKGSWLIKILSLFEAQIRGYALAPENDFDLYHVINGDLLCDSVIADLRDRASLKKAILDFEPDFIFHLAAQPLVRLSYEMPSETFEVNAIGTANLLDAVRLLQKPCQLVLITTDKVYHNNEWEYPYRENDRLGGYDPYSASKACAEIVIDSYRNSFFNINNYGSHKKAIAVGRAGNVIGGGDWAKDRLVPDIVRALINSKPVVIRNPKAVRPWQHVIEPLVGYLMLGKKLLEQPLRFSKAYNFGPYVNDALPVLEMTKLAIEAYGNGAYDLQTEVNQPHEAGLLKLDISKATCEIGWLPKLNAVAAINSTISWYKCNQQSPAEIEVFMERQIRDYLNV